MRETLLYLVYGDSRSTHLELSYSVLSAVQKSPRPPHILLVTDEKNRRDDLPIEHRFFSAEEFQRWSLGGTYLHAAKVGAFTTIAGEIGGKVAMIDTDTFFLEDPSRLFSRIGPGTAVMHEDEGSLQQQNGYWDRIIAGGPGINLASKMFNSGVIGIHESDRSALPAVLPLMQRLHRIDPEVHNVEQFAFGQVLPNIQTCGDLVRHYWGYVRPFVHARIAELFPTFTAETFARNLSTQHSVEGFPPRRKIDLIRAKLKQLQRRQSDTYRFAYLAYLSSLSTTDQTHAQCWMNVVRDAVRFNKWPAALVAADFAELTGGQDDGNRC